MWVELPCYQDHHRAKIYRALTSGFGGGEIITARYRGWVPWWGGRSPTAHRAGLEGLKVQISTKVRTIMNELTAAEFLRTRRQWLGVRKVWNPAMRGGDLGVVIDGHFFPVTHAERTR